MLIAAPLIAFVITKRICLGLQRENREKRFHASESGRVLHLPDELVIYEDSEIGIASASAAGITRIIDVRLP